MSKVTFVKCAAKDNPALSIKKGDSYYWWKHRFGPKQVSKTPPTPAMTTSSEFLRSAYNLNDELAAFVCSTVEDAETQTQDLSDRARELAEECQEKFDNMPEGLQQGSTGELLQERVDGMNELADALENLDLDISEKEESETLEAFNERFAERIEEINSEVTALSYEGS